MRNYWTSAKLVVAMALALALQTLRKICCNCLGLCTATIEVQMELMVGFGNCDERKKEMGEALVNFYGDFEVEEDPYASQ